MNRQVNKQHLNTYVTVTQITVTLYKTISYIRYYQLSLSEFGVRVSSSLHSAAVYIVC